MICLSDLANILINDWQVIGSAIIPHSAWIQLEQSYDRALYVIVSKYISILVTKYVVCGPPKLEKNPSWTLRGQILPYIWLQNGRNAQSFASKNAKMLFFRCWSLRFWKPSSYNGNHTKKNRKVPRWPDCEQNTAQITYWRKKMARTIL